jgi:penicillin amidase
VVSDLYVESVTTRAPPRYHDGDGWRPLAERVEEIAVRGGGSERLVVHATRHGPLVNALLEPDRPPLALRWPGGEAGAGIEAFFEVALARDAAALRDALALHVEPVLAVAYADAGGAAGVQTAGFVPERGLPTSLLPVPARDPDYEWRGRLPLARLPARALAAGEGAAVAADGALPGGGGIEWLWRSGERSARLDALLAEARSKGPLDLRTAVELQRDLRSERAGAVIERALALVGPGVLAPPEREVIALLEGWDRASDGASRGAAAYHAFEDRLLRELLEEPVGKDLLARYVGLGRVRATDLVHALLVAAEAGGAPFADPERVAAAVRRSLRGAWLALSATLGTNREKWTWARLHPLRFRPLLAGDAALGPFYYAGDAASVQLADRRPLEPFGVSAAAIYRFAIDAAALDEALVSYAPGQSEHAGHPHRDDALERWRVGRPGLLATSRLVVEELAAERLELVPAP